MGHNKKEDPVPDKNKLPYPHRTLDPPFSIVDQAKEIEKAESSLKTKVHHKLDVILHEIRHLQDEAKKIIEDAHKDMELHKVPCSFEKKPGEIIHLYHDPVKGLYFSRLSPQDWGNNPPHTFKGSYRIELDKSFTEITSPKNDT